MNHTMHIIRDRAQLAQILPSLRASSRRLALVPTMGALHQGHISLLATGHRIADLVAVSIFVNPTQFDQSTDLARYPRDEEGDLAKLRAAGCDLVWLPDAATMYAVDESTRIEPAGPALGFEGAQRPGHFAGVATVVTKLFGQIRPDAAIFGEKDWQQLQVIRRFTADLELGVEIVSAPIERAQDGLALSSRNVFLTPSLREIAPRLFATLTACAKSLAAGSPHDQALQTARENLAVHGFVLDYLAHIHGPSMRETAEITPESRLITTARLGSVRLLDNVPVIK